MVEFGVGVGLKEMLLELGDWIIGMIGFGEMFFDYENCIYLNKKVIDKWGFLVFVMDVEIKENEFKMCKDM